MLEVTGPSKNRISSGVEKTIKCFLVVLIVFLHFLIRDYASNRISLDQRDPRTFYSNRYVTALALVFGKGYTGLPLPDEPASRPIQDFVALKKNSLDQDE